MIKILSFLYLLIFVCSCASTNITIESDPPAADVYLSKAGVIPQKIGQTPLNLPNEKIGPNAESVVVSIEKPGYKRESALIPHSSIGQNAKVSFFLKEEIIQRVSNDLDVALDEVARGVAQIQESIRVKEFDTALSTSSSLLVKYKNVATLHGLQGNIYYLQKNIDKALSSYKKAQAINPNSETQRMIMKLESLRGGSSQ